MKLRTAVLYGLLFGSISSAALAQSVSHHNPPPPDDELIVLGWSGNDYKPLSWWGDIYSTSNNTFRMSYDHAGDEIFIDSFEPLQFAWCGWGFQVDAPNYPTYADHLNCGQWSMKAKVVINCFAHNEETE